MFQEPFEIRIDDSNCTSLVEGIATLEKKTIYEIHDSWRYKDIQLESGKIYGIILDSGKNMLFISK